MHILDLDIGNTSTKWKLIQQASGLDSIIERGYGNQDALIELYNRIHKLDRIRVASVKNRTFTKEVLNDAEKKFAIASEYVRVQEECSYVDLNHYTEIGVDRWLAMVGAASRVKGAILVVDIGTAITVDCLDDRRRHLGGYIVPGMNLQLRALEHFTDIPIKSPLSIQKQEELPHWGNNTKDCIEQGTQSLVQAFILNAIERCVDQWEKVHCFISGGQGIDLFPLLQANVDENKVVLEKEPYLVIDAISMVLK